MPGFSSVRIARKAKSRASVGTVDGSVDRDCSTRTFVTIHLRLSERRRLGRWRTWRANRNLLRCDSRTGASLSRRRSGNGLHNGAGTGAPVDRRWTLAVALSKRQLDATNQRHLKFNEAAIQRKLQSRPAGAVELKSRKMIRVMGGALWGTIGGGLSVRLSD